ncbi:hypothetical protein HPG69_006382 [Diceros bicornis minor]|uniref:Uncharacterized protein n=1 Tax=Diceros bicornis minor TaxID=77932 RepID=A0A7J7EWC0_DICBM|nr:hypothetical protein HPG69_006382 [Diceros bicornis minor]
MVEIRLSISVRYSIQLQLPGKYYTSSSLKPAHISSWVFLMQGRHISSDKGEQEHPGTQQSDVLPNADGTWYLQVFLDVETIEAAGLSCWYVMQEIEKWKMSDLQMKEDVEH